MGLLRTVESGIERAVGGVFGRAYRGHVSPAEMALKLVKEMEERKTPSFSRTYVPNQYTVYLCPDDRDHFRAYERSLSDELSEHVRKHAQKEGYVLVGPPRVGFKTDPDLKRGQFGIQTEMAEVEDAGPSKKDDRAPRRDEPGFQWEPPASEGAPAERGETGSPPSPSLSDLPLAAGAAPLPPGGPVPFFPPQEEAESARRERSRPPEDARPPGMQTESIPAGVAAAMGLARQTIVLHHDGHRLEFEKGRIVLGRGRQVDFQLDDPNVSRRHAVIYWENGRLFLKDLGSTNGTLLNGRPVTAGPLAAGDVITAGGSEIRVETG